MKTKKLIIITSLVLILAMALTGTVYAILHGASNTATNTLTPDSDNTPEVAETFENGVKYNVKFTNTADYSVYVRAAVVVTWQNADGEVHSVRPITNTNASIADYQLDIDSTDWFFDAESGLYYYKHPVPGGESTTVLLNNCRQTGTAPAGYKLHVELVCQTVQAKGTTDDGNVPAVVDAWGVTLNGDDISAVTTAP
ncbi:MAG: hypothetical protein J6V01_03325 [Clostridia bacterium]|nr:hypothetical protein [Clostridia bacterium]